MKSGSAIQPGICEDFILSPDCRAGCALFAFTWFDGSHFDETWNVAFFRHDQHPVSVSADHVNLRSGRHFASSSELRARPGAHHCAGDRDVRAELFVDIRKVVGSSELLALSAAENN